VSIEAVKEVKPFLAPHGKGTEYWEKVKERVNEEVCNILAATRGCGRSYEWRNQ
jgi:hypothetical protein